MSPRDSHAAHVKAVTALSRAGEHAALLQADQLLACRAKGEAFVGFVEGSMAFAPTFKVGTPVDPHLAPT